MGGISLSLVGATELTRVGARALSLVGAITTRVGATGAAVNGSPSCTDYRIADT